MAKNGQLLVEIDSRHVKIAQTQLEYARGIHPKTGAMKSYFLECLLSMSSPRAPSPGVLFEQMLRK